MTTEPSHLPAPPSPRSRRLALASGLTYHLLEWDGGGDHTVVLVHGFLDLAWTWDEVATRLAARGLHVIAPDLRGHGDSDWIGDGGYYHFFDYVADLDEVIARTARARRSVVGHSMGGSVSSYWAGTRPEQVHRLALLEGIGPPDVTANAPQRTATWIDAWRRTRNAPVRVMQDVDAAAARIHKHDALIDLEQARWLARHGTRPVDGGVAWKHDPLHLTAGPYLYKVEIAESFWRRITAPVLYLDGARSMLRLPDAEVTRRLAVFPSVRRATIADAGHAMQRHQPEQVAAALLEHLA
ncbi:MAG TPA: alpha/beta hydrolase [Kofleriaceae bacterium]|nr:alpha/beta hydrolase [Kofleriaceae bacterium]